MKRFSLILVLFFAGLSFMATAQVTPKAYDDCKYWELIEQLRAYEDTLASEQSLLDTLRGEYGVAVTDPGVSARVYRVYRCAALLDSLTNLQDSLDFLRADPPTVQSDSISGITSSSATLHGRLLLDGGEPVTERWFKYGTSRTALNDTITAVVGVPDSIFTANLTGLTPPGTWYMAAVAKNAKGTSSGDTLQFITAAAPTMDSDSTSLRTASTATLHGKVISDGGGDLTHQWFRYGLSATSLTDSIAASGAGSGTPPLTSPFSAGITGLTAATKYYFAAFGKNAAGTAAGDTLSFWTKCSVDSVSHDGHWYGVVMVGDKCWFDENLKTDQYRNGDLIAGNLDSLTWSTTTSGAQAVQDQGGPNETTNLNTYGRLYNFHAVNDSRGLCPAGWDVPTKAEWDSLYARVGGEAVAGKELKAPAPRWNGVNTNGFDIVQGGARKPDGGFQPTIGIEQARFWTSTPNGGQAYYRYFTTHDDAYGYFNGLRNGFSVRCIQDSTTLSAPVVRTDSISSITSTTATFHGRVLSDGGETVTERWFKYGTSRTALNDTITAVVGVPDSIFTANITGLTPPGTWYMVAVAKNAKGTSSGDTLQFMTAVAPTMDTDSTSLRTATTATLHGKVISDGGGALTHQWFRYGTSAAALNDSIAASGTGSGTPPLTSPFSAGITGLTAATKYYFAAFGKNAAGTSAGDTLSFWTKCSVDSVSHDGHWYGVVMVGEKCWFDENLKTDKYRNGDLIAGNLDSLTWSTTTSGAQAVQDQGGPNETTNLNTYGRLYNFYAVEDSRGLCPTGWHVPTKAEWDTLYARVGGEAVAGKQLKAPAPRWDGLNSNGFDVLQGGARKPDGGFQPTIGIEQARFWTSTPNGGQAYYRYFNTYDDSYGYFNGRRNGFSVRCIED